jgi:threonine synthase
MAKALGATDVCLPSAGNAGSALAAYAAKGGLKAHVFVPKDIAQLFLMETRAYGAEVETVDGLITDAGKICAERAKENGWYECATLKEPYRVEGKKTMGYELAEQMGWKLPDAILYPTGGRHRPHRHVEGLPRDGADGATSGRAGRACTRSRPRAARPS